MAQYIDKSAVLAEIERRRESNAKERYFGRLVEDNYFLDFLDTLEVKEVDLNLAYHDFLESHKTTGYMLFEVAEYFFELGLKAQKGEEL